MTDRESFESWTCAGDLYCKAQATSDAPDSGEWQLMDEAETWKSVTVTIEKHRLNAAQAPCAIQLKRTLQNPARVKRAAKRAFTILSVV